MKAHVSLVLLALTACGGDDDGASTDSGPQVELTGEDILAELLDVDGDGSGLDADSLDGLDSADFARAGKRTVTVQPGAIFGGGAQSLPESGGSVMQVAFRVPEDAVPGEPLELLTVGTTGNTPCGLRLSARFRIFVDGSAGDVSDGDMAGSGGPSATLTVPQQNVPFEVSATYDDPGFDPGAWVLLSIARTFDDAEDTCDGAFQIYAAAVEYQGR